MVLWDPRSNGPQVFLVSERCANTSKSHCCQAPVSSLWPRAASKGSKLGWSLFATLFSLSSSYKCPWLLQRFILWQTALQKPVSYSGSPNWTPSYLLRGSRSLRVSHTQSCLALCPPGSSVHGIFQARILEWVIISSPGGSSWPRDWTRSPALQAHSLLSELLPPIQISYCFYDNLRGKNGNKFLVF